MENEKRLIDANAEIQKIQSVLDEHPNDKDSTAYYSLSAFIECLKSAPTVDAVEVVHAEWACVNESENVWMCTGKNGCGNEVLLLEGTPSENGWYYCPNCGAKMYGGNEDA